MRPEIRSKMSMAKSKNFRFKNFLRGIRSQGHKL